MSQTNALYNDVKSRILVMLEESDHLDYAIHHIDDRTACSIYVAYRGLFLHHGLADLQIKKPDFRIVISEVKDHVATAIKRGTSRDILDPQRSIGTAEDVESFLRLVTEFIEHVDNDVDVTGGPKRV